MVLGVFSVGIASVCGKMDESIGTADAGSLKKSKGSFMSLVSKNVLEVFKHSEIGCSGDKLMSLDGLSRLFRRFNGWFNAFLDCELRAVDRMATRLKDLKEE
jgi:hypothetical protein